MTDFGPSVEQEIVVSLDVERAFARFTEEIDLWWPKKHSRSGSDGSVVTLEAVVDGRMFETTEAGEVFPFGKVVSVDPPSSIALDWFMGTGPDNPSRVEIRFEAVDSGTKVSVCHHGVEVIGELWWKRVSIFDNAWSDVLGAFST